MKNQMNLFFKLVKNKMTKILFYQGKNVAIKKGQSFTRKYSDNIIPINTNFLDDQILSLKQTKDMPNKNKYFKNFHKCISNS